MSKQTRRFFVVSYDIANDRRRNKVADLLLSYGDRIQFSVFVVISRPANLARMRTSLKELINPAEDSIAIFDLGVYTNTTRDRLMTFIGQAKPTTPTDVIIL